MADLANCSGPHTWIACTSLNCLIDWFDHWQTMLAGAAALLAGAASVYYLRKQINDAAALETGRRARRLAAARARLPLLLSDTSDYASQAIGLLKSYLDAASQPAAATAALSTNPLPTLPDPAILALAAAIEATDDSEFAIYIAEMISQMQVLNARLRALPAEARALGEIGIQSYLMNAAKVHGYASGLFDFARREADDPPHTLNWELVASALRLNGLYADAYSELHAFVVRTRDRESQVAEGGQAGPP